MAQETFTPSVAGRMVSNLTPNAVKTRAVVDSSNHVMSAKVTTQRMAAKISVAKNLTARC